MEFNDGDRIIGQYGNEWQRWGGRWRTLIAQDEWTDSFGDDTAEWLINLKVTYPKPVEKNVKFSKSETNTIQYIYNYTYRRYDG